MTPIEIAWLAGWLEGEGCFYCKTGSSSTGIKVTATDLDVVNRVALLIGAKNVFIANKRRQKELGHKPAYTASVHGEKAELVMRTILPYMGKRRSTKIKELLLVRESWLTSGKLKRNKLLGEASKRMWENQSTRHKILNTRKTNPRYSGDRQASAKHQWENPEARAKASARVKAWWACRKSDSPNSVENVQ